MTLDIEKSSEDSGIVAEARVPDATPVEGFVWGDPREKRNPKNWSTSKRVFHNAFPSMLAFQM